MIKVFFFSLKKANSIYDVSLPSVSICELHNGFVEGEYEVKIGIINL